MNPNTPTLAMIADRFFCLRGSMCRQHYPKNIALPRCAALLGFLGPINTCLIDATVAALVRDKAQRARCGHST